MKSKKLLDLYKIACCNEDNKLDLLVVALDYKKCPRCSKYRVREDFIGVLKTEIKTCKTCRIDVSLKKNKIKKK